MVLFIRDNECFEPRVQNYLDYFEKHNIEYHVLAWNRSGKAQSHPRITYFERRAEYGKRIKNIPNKLLWMFFVIKGICKLRKQIRIIHACDIDAVLPALFIGRLLKKTVIWDIFDWISSRTGKGIVYKIVEFLQNWAYKKADYVILCEEERKAQTKRHNDNILVLPNIPNDVNKFDEETLRKTAQQRTTYKYVISYVGVFDKDRGLENLLDVVSMRRDVLLNIAGFGVLDDLVRGFSSKYSNICCWGRVDYEVGQAIMKNSDMIAAMYHLTSPLHKFAAPNKYYESLYLGVPMITTENTLVGSKVKKFDTGFVISEEKESLAEIVDCNNLLGLLNRKKENCKRIWEEVYFSYYEKFMREKYLKIIK